MFSMPKALPQPCHCHQESESSPFLQNPAWPFVRTAAETKQQQNPQKEHVWSSRLGVPTWAVGVRVGIIKGLLFSAVGLGWARVSQLFLPVTKMPKKRNLEEASSFCVMVSGVPSMISQLYCSGPEMRQDIMVERPSRGKLVSAWQPGSRERAGGAQNKMSNPPAMLHLASCHPGHSNR